MVEQVSVENCGGGLREVRSRSGVTLASLAERVDLSKGYLSQIESGKKIPHWSTLMRIVHELDSTLCRFLSEESRDGSGDHAEVAGVMPSTGIIRLAGGVPDEWGVVEEADREGYTWILTPDREGHLRSEVLRFRIPPHTSWTPELIRFSAWGQAFCLEGRALLETGKNERDEFLLSAGQTIGYEGRLPHRFRNYTDNPAEILLTVTPPGI